MNTTTLCYDAQPVTINKNMLLIAMMLIVPFLGFSIDLYAPSLPAISLYFHTSTVLVRDTFITYLLGYGFGQLFYGPLSDSFGRRRLMMAGLFFNILAALIAANAVNIEMLLMARLLQGVTMAAVGVLMRTILVDCFSGEELTKVLSNLTFAWALSPIVAPMLGGYIESYFGWKANFYLLAIYGVMSLCLTFYFVPETNENFVTLNVKKIRNNFATIITSKMFICFVGIMALSYTMMAVFNMTGPFLIENVLKFSPVQYGHVALFMGFGYFLGTMLNRIAIRYYSSVRIIKTHLYLMAFAALVMLLIGLFHYFNIYVLAAPVFVLLFSAAFVITNAMSLALSQFPKFAGAASSLIGTIVMVSSACVTFGAGFLKSQTQIPMAVTYVLLVLVCLGLFYVGNAGGYGLGTSPLCQHSFLLARPSDF